MNKCRILECRLSIRERAQKRSVLSQSEGRLSKRHLQTHFLGFAEMLHFSNDFRSLATPPGVSPFTLRISKIRNLLRPSSSFNPASVISVLLRFRYRKFDNFTTSDSAASVILQPATSSALSVSHLAMFFRPAAVTFVRRQYSCRRLGNSEMGSIASSPRFLAFEMETSVKFLSCGRTPRSLSSNSVLSKTSCRNFGNFGRASRPFTPVRARDRTSRFFKLARFSRPASETPVSSSSRKRSLSSFPTCLKSSSLTFVRLR